MASSAFSIESARSCAGVFFGSGRGELLGKMKQPWALKSSAQANAKLRNDVRNEFPKTSQDGLSLPPIAETAMPME